MRRLFAALVLSLAATRPAVAQHSTTSARGALDAANARAVDAYNRGDIARFAQVYASDATVMPANSAAIHGQPSIERFWQGGWSMGIRNLKLTTTELTVNGATASEVGQYDFDLQPGTAAAAHDHGKYIVLWRRGPRGEWQWYRDIFNSDVAAAPAPASQSATSRALGAAAPGDTAWVVVYNVRPEKRSDYEGFITRFWRTGLEYGAHQDASVLPVFQHTRVLYPNRMNRDSTYTYMFVMDPVVPGGEYDIEKLLRRMLPADQAAAEYRAFTESLASDKANYRQFWTMRQH